MRHAAPHTTIDRKLNRANQIAFGAVVYTIAALTTALTTLGSALAFWGLWQWLGVN